MMGDPEIITITPNLRWLAAHVRPLVEAKAVITISRRRRDEDLLRQAGNLARLRQDRQIARAMAYCSQDAG